MNHLSGSSSRVAEIFETKTKMCEDVSVTCWLENLRYDFEYYEPYDVRVLEISEMEGEFLNLWDCSSCPLAEIEEEEEEVKGQGEETGKLDIKYGSECRVSVVFTEELGELEVVRPIFARISWRVPDAVMLWTEALRSECSDEEDILESQVVTSA